MSIDNKKLKVCPKITEASVVKGGKIKLYWTAVPEAEKYCVKRSEKPDGEYENLKWTKKTAYTDEDVRKDVAYWYKIVAAKELEKKKKSKTTSPIAGQIVSDIPAPFDVTAVPVSENNEITLRWVSPGDNYNFVINRRNNFFNQILPVGEVEKAEFTDRDIVPGQVYHYSVQCVINSEDGRRQGNFSKEISCICLDCGEIVEAKTGAFGKAFIQVRIVAGADGYILERSSDGGSFEEVARTDSGVDLRFTDKAGKLFTTYYYRTRAFRKVGDKEFVSEASESVKVKTR